MSTPLPESSTNQKISSYVYLISIYFVALGVLYLWGFWSSFGIDILPYVGIADAIRLTLYPIAAGVAAFIVGAILGFIDDDYLDQRAKPSNPGKIARLINNPTFKKTIWWISALAVVIFLPDLRWYAIGIGVVQLTTPLMYKFRKSFLPEVNHRLHFVLMVLPFISYGQGRVDASAIQSDKDYLYVATDTIAGMPTTDPDDPAKHLKYLGIVNGNIFLLQPDNTTLLIVAFDKIDSLQLRHFKKLK